MLAQGELLRCVRNSLWMLGGYIVNLVSTVVVGIYVARYLGPENYGLLSYVVALLGLLFPLAGLSMNSVLVRELARGGEQSILLGTAKLLTICSSLACLLFLVLLAFLTESDADMKFYLLVASISFVFQPLSIYDNHFRATLNSKMAVLAQTFSMLLGAIIKVALVLTKANVLSFVVTIVVEKVLWAIALLTFKHRHLDSPSIFDFNFSVAMSLLRSALPLTASFIAIAIYMRFDQVMINMMMSTSDLGIYSSSVRIYEAVVGLGVVLSMSLLPVMTKAKEGDDSEYEQQLTRLFGIMFWFGAVSMLCIVLLRDSLIEITFGEQFSGAEAALGIMALSLPFAAIGSATARYLTVEKREKILLLRTVVTAVVNVGLNLQFIPRFGIEGAAVSTVIAIIFGNYLINYFDSSLNQLRRLVHRGMFLRVWI